MVKSMDHLFYRSSNYVSSLKSLSQKLMFFILSICDTSLKSVCLFKESCMCYGLDNIFQKTLDLERQNKSKSNILMACTPAQ